jgi:hypothetical protein
VFAVGNDWDNAIARTLPAGWTMLDQWTNTSVGDDYWSQYTNTPTGASGTVVNVIDTAPTTDSGTWSRSSCWATAADGVRGDTR